MTKANDYQVGGDHYSQAGRYQHWDFIEDHGIGYLEGYATKYLVRWDKKGMPVQDLEKSQHIVAKLIELTEAGRRKNRASMVPTVESIGLFCSANKVKDEHTAKAIELLFRWRTLADIEEALHHVRYVLEEQPSQRVKRDYDKGGRKPATEQEHPFGYDAKEEENVRGEFAEDRDVYREAGIWPKTKSERDRSGEGS
jgi:hypothetical protein